ncbi:MAG TPA: hypothetical protein VGK98_03515 [Arthrobacter sp.]|uniref:hypothetical protein n=1 Tax=Arthrobacter sp. TaxID=1667 RepID=UPI002F422024
MSTTTGTGTAIIGPDADSLQRADRVIESLTLPDHGIAVQDPATGETLAHVRTPTSKRL